jgi:hypothetical protein
MSKNYHVVPRDECWAVVGEGAERASSLHDTQADAIDAGRPLAQKSHGELKIHGEDGRIREAFSYGHDPYPPRG